VSSVYTLAVSIKLPPAPNGRHRKSREPRSASGCGGRVLGCGAHQQCGRCRWALYRAVVDADLEGFVAKNRADAYQVKLARWHKIAERDPLSIHQPLPPKGGRETTASGSSAMVARHSSVTRVGLFHRIHLGDICDASRVGAPDAT
jgi:hypothetical protein